MNLRNVFKFSMIPLVTSLIASCGGTVGLRSYYSVCLPTKDPFTLEDFLGQSVSESEFKVTGWYSVAEGTTTCSGLDIYGIEEMMIDDRQLTNGFSLVIQVSQAVSPQTIGNLNIRGMDMETGFEVNLGDYQLGPANLINQGLAVKVDYRGIPAGTLILADAGHLRQVADELGNETVISIENRSRNWVINR